MNLSNKQSPSSPPTTNRKRLLTVRSAVSSRDQCPPRNLGCLARRYAFGLSMPESSSFPAIPPHPYVGSGETPPSMSVLLLLYGVVQEVHVLRTSTWYSVCLRNPCLSVPDTHISDHQRSHEGTTPLTLLSRDLNSIDTYCIIMKATANSVVRIVGKM